MQLAIEMVLREVRTNKFNDKDAHITGISRIEKFELRH